MLNNLRKSKNGDAQQPTEEQKNGNAQQPTEEQKW